MKHYNRCEWLQFKSGQLQEDLSMIMGAHLEECGECLEIYLSLIDKKEVCIAGDRLSPGFTDRVMQKVTNEKEPDKRVNHIAEKKQTLAFYYVAAASITLILMSGGLFNNLVKMEKSSLFLTTIKTDTGTVKISDWSEKLVNKAAVWIKNFEGQGRF